MSSPMTALLKVGHKSHPIDRKKYGQPRFALYWAGRAFTHPGLYVWTGTRQIRVVPVPKAAR